MDRELLIELYINRKLNMTEIANEMGCSRKTISNYLKKYEIKSRKGGYVSKDDLIKLYVIGELSVSEIAKKLNYNTKTIYKYLRIYGITRNTTSLILHKDDLVKLHITDKLSVAKIADKLGSSVYEINRLLREYKIETPTFTFAATKDDLIKLHITDKLSVAKIADKLGCSRNTVTRYLKKYDIDLVAHSILNIDKEVLVQLYVIDKKNITEISAELHTNHSVILRNLKRHGIEIRGKYKVDLSKSELEELHHNDELSLSEISGMCGCHQTTVANALNRHEIKIINRHSMSSNHVKVKKILDELSIEYTDDDRQPIAPFELDVYIPSKKLAIELNGVYWHSEKFKDKNYHYNKWLECKNRGIRLLQIWEDDYSKNPDIIEKFIKYQLGNSGERVFARKTKSIRIDNKTANEFHTNNHIQGKCPISFSYGLVYCNEIVAICSFKMRSSGIFELVRYSTSINVVGGFTKLLSLFEKSNEYVELITFADLCISNGNLYELSGFTMDKLIPPDYKYLIDSTRKHKFGFRKNSIKSNKLLKYEDGLTEKELMELNGILRVYDAGKKRYKKRGN